MRCTRRPVIRQWKESNSVITNYVLLRTTHVGLIYSWMGLAILHVRRMAKRNRQNCELEVEVYRGMKFIVALLVGPFFIDGWM
jgi:hypothetical protein